MEQNKFTALEKLNILQEIECGELGLKAVARKYGVSKTSVVKWRSRYQLYGYEDLEVRSRHQKYSVELKRQAIQDDLEGGLSQYQIIDKYIAGERSTKQATRRYYGTAEDAPKHLNHSRRQIATGSLCKN